MPFGIELTEIFLFLRQVGLAVAGASALWGLVFLFKGHKEPERDTCMIFDWVSIKLLLPLSLGFVLGAVSWFVLTLLVPAYAHEGIVIAPEHSQIYDALNLMFPFYLIWIVFTVVGLLVVLKKKKSLHKYLGIFFIFEFILVLILMSVPALSKSFGNEQLFFTGHSVHSIFTVGTVLILDFLFLISKSSNHLKQHLFVVFPLLSKVIWVGLGIDFISVALVFGDAISLTPKFFFMQTLIGILIINGVLLGGPVARRLIASVRQEGKQPLKRWILIGDIAGTISITSWLSITFVDSFENLTLSYSTLMMIYVLVIIVLFSGHRLLNKEERDLDIQSIRI